MDEILQNLLSSELLSEDAKSEISTKWANAVEQFKTTVREEESIKVRSEIAEQWAVERDNLIESVEQFVSQSLTSEVGELKSDIERFRDLEAEYAANLVEEKHSLAAKLDEQLDELVDRIDAFFDMALPEEIDELREDLEIAKQNQFGRKIFEAFASEFTGAYVDEDSTQSKLSKALSDLKEAKTAIADLEQAKAKMVRESKMDAVLANLQGKKRDTMAFILANVETERLEEAYTHFINRVMKEESQESAKAPLVESVVVTGDDSSGAKQPITDNHSQLRKLAGIN